MIIMRKRFLGNYYISDFYNNIEENEMQLQTNSDRREIKSHGSFSFPVFISYERLSSYERGAFSWHWHPEIELTLFLEGEMEYQVNDRIYRMKAGQGLFCNSNALHSGHMTGNTDCLYLSVTFHPRLLYGFEGSRLQTEFVEPLLRDPAFGSAAFSGDAPWERELLQKLREIRADYDGQSPVFALRLERELLAIWELLYSFGRPVCGDSHKTAQGREVERIRAALDYLHSHYAESVSLEQVAKQMNLCRSESCRFFKKYMKQSVFDYLQSYRIEKSLSLLAGEERSVTEIAILCGFASPSYFTKIFKEQMKCTPLAYRRSIQGHADEA